MNEQRTGATPLLARLFGLTATLLLAVSPGAAGEASSPIDWQAVPVRTVELFQPGQSSWEWLLIPANHGAGARRMREGRTCLSCHQGEERAIGTRIGGGDFLEPEPMQGMPGVIDVQLQVARDDQSLHLRAAWKALADTAPPAGDSPTPARITVVLGSAALPTAAIAGCWASCHNDSPGMPDAHAERLTKYLPNSRVRMSATGGGTELRSESELAAELTAGRFLEYWQAKITGDGVREIVDGHFLADRHRNDTPALSAEARLEGGRWVVELTRPLQASGEGRLTIEPGTSYTLALAVHDNHATHRHHYVGFPLQMVLDGGDADLVVTRP